MARDRRAGFSQSKSNGRAEATRRPSHQRQLPVQSKTVKDSHCVFGMAYRYANQGRVILFVWRSRCQWQRTENRTIRTAVRDACIPQELRAA